jgi:Periplasmic component of the Tol biopolymer transport system
MKKLAVAGALAYAVITAAPVATQSSSPATGLTIDQLIDIRHPSNSMWTPDGKSVVFVWDRAGISSVYMRPRTAKRRRANSERPVHP